MSLQSAAAVAKHFRWTQNGTQYRRKAGTRSWEEAEQQKKFLEDQLAGRTPRVETTGKLLIEAMATALRNWILKH